VSAKYSSTNKRHLEEMDVFYVKSMGPSGIKEKETIQVRIDLEDEESRRGEHIQRYLHTWTG
jgi:EARLY FLOWERING 3 protein